MKSTCVASKARIFVWLAGLIAGLANAACELPAALASAAPVFTSKGDGLAIWSAELNDPKLKAITVLRLDRASWSPRIMDLREIAAAYAQQKRFVQPAYSIGEALGLQNVEAIAMTAGFTQMLNAPVPAGLLVADSVEHAPAFRSSRIMDGHVCIRGGGDIEILSTIVAGARRAPESAAGCRDALQAGPVLIYEGQAQVKSHQSLAARVVLATDSEDRFLIGYSPSATTYAMGCALSHPALGTRAAINLQGDAFASVAFGPKLAAQIGHPVMGSPDLTVASAIIFRKAGARTIKASVKPAEWARVDARPDPKTRGKIETMGSFKREDKSSTNSKILMCDESGNAKCR